MNEKTTTWPNLRKNRGQMPLGYKVSPEDPLLLIADPDQTPYLDKALEMLDKNASLKEAQEWLLVNGKIEVSQMGLKKIWDRLHGHKDTPRKRRLAALKDGTINEHNRKLKEKAKKRAQGHRAGGKITQLKLAQKKKEIEQKKREARIHGNTSVTYDFEKIPKEKEVVFKPNPGPQTDFLAASEREVLYGGAAGGEPKSWFFCLLSQ